MVCKRLSSQKTDRKGGDDMDHGKGGCPEPGSVKQILPWRGS